MRGKEIRRCEEMSYGHNHLARLDRLDRLIKQIRGLADRAQGKQGEAMHSLANKLVADSQSLKVRLAELGYIRTDRTSSGGAA